jgi:hypothetical protein
MLGAFIDFAGVKAYRILDLTQRVRVARDVIFDEGHGWDWAKDTSGGTVTMLSDFGIAYVQLRGSGEQVGLCLRPVYLP